MSGQKVFSSEIWFNLTQQNVTDHQLIFWSDKNQQKTIYFFVVNFFVLDDFIIEILIK